MYMYVTDIIYNVLFFLIDAYDRSAYYMLLALGLILQPTNVYIKPYAYNFKLHVALRIMSIRLVLGS